MTDTADLSNAEVGDILHLRCGGKVVVTHVDDEDVIGGNGIVYGHGASWCENGSFNCSCESDLDCIRLEKAKKHEVEVDLYIIRDEFGLGKIRIWLERPETQSQYHPVAKKRVKITFKEGEGL